MPETGNGTPVAFVRRLALKWAEMPWPSKFKVKKKAMLASGRIYGNGFGHLYIHGAACAPRITDFSPGARKKTGLIGKWPVRLM